MSTLLVALKLPSHLPQNTQRLCDEIKQNYALASHALDALFWQGQPIKDILYTRASWCDAILIFAWKLFQLEQEQAQLIAVGGYGNSRLHPFSDADILILIESLNPQLNAKIEKFIAFCWDANIKLGASVRTLKECFEQAQEDHTVYTNLLSARLLRGADDKFAAFLYQLQNNDSLWPLPAYFKAKQADKTIRHSNFAHSVYHLEPNIKGSPGGLRDIDFVNWMMAKKYHLPALDQKEYETLTKAQDYLWHLRYALHLVAKAPCDKLYFEHQIALATRFHIQAPSTNKRVCLLMQPFYQAANVVDSLTHLLCQQYQEDIEALFAHPAQPLTSFCENRQGYLHITDEHLSPVDFISLFYLFAKNRLNAFTVSSLRIIAKILRDAPLTYFEDNAAGHIFLMLFSLPNQVAKTLSLMQRLSVLKHYIPEFDAITGQMQYDLTHIYTVDAHTLKLVHYLEVFACQHQFEKFDYLAECKNQIVDFSVLYLSGLFHDIGKGQGGNHSQIGSKIVADFCHKYQLSKQTSALICWLVENHLLMSITSQRKDIHDEQVIINFSKQVNTLEKLKCLYVFTVADMLATNPTLWNEWRASLLQELYVRTAQFLQNNKLFIKEKITFPQTPGILKNQHAIHLSLKAHTNLRGLDLTIYAPDKPNLFAAVCACLEKCYLTIVQARINHTPTDYSLQHFVALEIGDILVDQRRLQEIENQLHTLLKPIEQGKDCSIPSVSRHVPRALYFNFDSAIHISHTNENNRTLIEVIAPDFPGLLARIGEVFVNANVRVHSAMINTLGNQVEDTFYLLDKETFKPITDQKRLNTLCDHIQETIKKHCK